MLVAAGASRKAAARVAAVFILRECQTLIWKPQNSRRRRSARGQRPKELADISNAVATPEGQQTQHVRNYHDEEKTLKHQLFLIRTWDFPHYSH